MVDPPGFFGLTPVVEHAVTDDDDDGSLRAPFCAPVGDLSGSKCHIPAHVSI